MIIPFQCHFRIPFSTDESATIARFAGGLQSMEISKQVLSVLVALMAYKNPPVVDMDTMETMAMQELLLVSRSRCTILSVYS